MMPASYGSIRGLESWDVCVWSPELRTQYSEAQECAARLLKPVDTGKLQKVAVGDKTKVCALAGQGDWMFHDVISA
jgi:hypothetical protein